jgi:hypothetical protein
MTCRITRWTLHPGAPIFRTRGWRVETRKQDSAAAIVLKALGAAYPESMASEQREQAGRR